MQLQPASLQIFCSQLSAPHEATAIPVYTVARLDWRRRSQPAACVGAEPGRWERQGRQCRHQPQTGAAMRGCLVPPEAGPSAQHARWCLQHSRVPVRQVLCTSSTAAHWGHSTAGLRKQPRPAPSRCHRWVTIPAVPSGAAMAGQGLLRGVGRLGGAGCSTMREKALPWREVMRGVSSIPLTLLPPCTSSHTSGFCSVAQGTQRRGPGIPDGTAGMVVDRPDARR